ncbi:hypothetical protein Acj133p220 [Acinetobacter phage 133]|uniref:Uncharacterized protein n=1 Tax=Acinetobacter phage 133 TaxID=2919552 RepID=D9I6F4_9CAUD|nr:hypothetical protein Acj133p220 [Acinetobacter phage 133]ADJ19535.1 hypothetical protein Acj133p220 [Acinetobacter phage 133]
MKGIKYTDQGKTNYRKILEVISSHPAGDAVHYQVRVQTLGVVRLEVCRYTGCAILKWPGHYIHCTVIRTKLWAVVLNSIWG